MIQRKTPDYLIDQMLTLCSDISGDVLEPSAGDGDICDKIRSKQLTNITAIELSGDKCDTLKSKGYDAIHTDFLLWVSDKQYDFIVAAPPFKGNSDCLHIMKMYEHLKSGGTVVTLTSPNWVNNNEPHQIQFRNWLDTVPHSLYKVKENSFVEKKGNIPTMILKLTKL